MAKKRLSSRQTLVQFIEQFKKFERKEGYFKPEYPFESVLTPTFVAPIKIREAKMVELEKYLLGKTHISEAKKSNEFVHDFEITTDKGVILCRLIMEDGPFRPDKKGRWGVNPLSFRVKK